MARWLRRIAIWFGVLVVVLVMLVVAAGVLVTQVPALRDRLATWGEALLLEYGEVKLEAKEVVRLDPWGAELRRAHVEIPEIGLSADVDRVRVSFRPWALLDKDVRFPRARLWGVRARFDRAVEKQLTPEQAAQEAADEAEDSGWKTTLLRVELTDGELITYQLPKIVLHVDSVLGATSYDIGPDIWVRRARMRVSQDGAQMLAVSGIVGTYLAAKGGTAKLEGQLAGAPLRFTARFPAWNASWDPIALDALHLSLGGVDRRALRRLGVEDTVRLRAPVDLGLSARREGDSLEFAFKLDGGGAVVRARGSFRNGSVQSRFDTHVRELGQVIEGLPQQAVRGTLYAQYEYGAGGQSVTARWGRVGVGKKFVPRGNLRVQLRDSLVVLERVELREHEGLLKGNGSYHRATGEAHATLSLFALRVEELGTWLGLPIGGVASGKVFFTRDRRHELRLDAHLFLGAPRYGESIGARRLASELTLSGTLASPRLVGTIMASDLRVERTIVPRLSAKVALENRNFSTYFDAMSKEVELHGLASGLLELEQTFGVTLRAELDGKIAGRELRAELAELQVAEGGLFVRDLRLRSGGARLAADGTYGTDGALDLSLRARDVPLSWVGLFAGVPTLRGRLTTRAHLTGSLERPMVALEASLLEVSVGDTTPLDSALVLSVDGAKRIASGELSSFGPAGRLVDASFELTWPSEPTAWWEALPSAHGRVYATLRSHVDDLPLPPAMEIPALAGSWVELGANVEGTLEDPSGLVTLVVRESADGPPQIDARALVVDRHATIDLTASDNRRRDPLLSAHATVALPSAGSSRLLSSLKDETPDVEARVQWQVDALDELRGALARVVHGLGADLPLRTAGNLVLTRDAGKLKGSLQATADIRSSQIDPDCGADVNANLILEADVDDQRLRGSLMAETSRGGNAFANWTLPTPWLWDWRRRNESEKGTLDVHAENLPLPALPGLCGLDNGYAQVSSYTTLVPGEPLSSTLDMHLEGLSAANAKPISIEINGKIDPKNFSVFAGLISEGKQRGTLEVTLPLRYDGYRPGVVLTEPIWAKLKAANLSLAPIMQFTDAVGRPSGRMSIDLDIRGSIRKPVPKGHVVMDDLSFTLASLAQPVRNLKGRLEFSGDTLTLHDVSARDRGGRLYVEGQAKLDPNGSANAKLNLKAENMPVRRQGQIVGKVTMGADVIAKLDQQTKLMVDAAVRYATMQFAGTTGKGIQEMDPHPDIRFAGDEREKEKLHLATSPSGFALRSFEVKSSKNLTLRHQDFSVEVGLDFVIKEVDGEEKLVGEAAIARGNLKVLGKSFNIQRGSVRFTEDSDEPELDLRASFDPPGGGTPLNLQVVGRASDPALNFSGAADTPEQAFAILSGMSSAQAAASAQADVNSFGLSLTAGLLSMTARQRFGSWVPTVSVGSNARGEASQARAGFDASKMIPPFMRGFARGAYVEGIVGNTQQGGPGGSVGLGVRFEIALPRSTVTTFGYGPGTNWSVDVAWVP